MDYRNKYAIRSLELHLFFARIMKEHALFLKAGFSSVDVCFARDAEFFKREFEKLLCYAIGLGDGVISKEVLCSGEILTEFTACAECQTQQLTGISINGDITMRESHMHCGENVCITSEFCHQVKQVNQTAIHLLDGFIALKESVLNNVLCCKMFTMNYPLLLEHIIREAKLYRTYLCNFEDGKDLDCDDMKNTEHFWNQIMMEHALFIRGLLDPTESDLVGTADMFAYDYGRLLESCREMHDRSIMESTTASLEETLKFRDFKIAGVKGIEACKIRSIILPLLADHVLREANHYIRLLRS